MYSVKLINGTETTTVHYPRPSKDTPKFLKLNLNRKKSTPDQLTFTIPYGNPGYDKLYDLVTLVQVFDTRDNSLKFEGRVISSPNKMDSTGQFFKEVTCEGELAYLNDTNTRAWDLSGKTVLTALQLIIDNHNSHTTSNKQFTLGNVDVTGVLDVQTNFEKSLNFLIGKFINKFGGVLKVRKSGGVRYLDYTGLTGQKCTQEITLGKNMQDMMLDTDVTNIATRVVVVGKNGTTIETVNNGKDYLEDADAVKQYGIIEQIADLKDIEDITLLKQAGQEYLDNAKKAKIKLQLTSIDLNCLNINIESFEVGDDVKIINEVMKVDDYFTVIEIDQDLLQPWNSKLTIDNKFETLTDRQINMQRAANALDAVLTAQGKLNTYYLQGIIDTLKNQLLASGAYQNAQVLEDKGFLLENTKSDSPDFGALYLGPGIFAIANTKTGGKWDYKTFGTGKGFVADYIVTGTLDANLVNVINLVADNIKSGTIDAKKITIINLDATNINTGTLDASKIKVVHLSADSIDSGSIDASKIKVINLDSDNINVHNLSADIITVGTLKVPAQWTHSDGTVSSFGSGGGTRYFPNVGSSGGSTASYKSCFYFGTGTVFYGTNTVIQLPDYFKNRTFDVMLNLRETSQSASYISKLTLHVLSYDYANGKFTVEGGVNVSSSDYITYTYTAVM